MESNRTLRVWRMRGVRRGSIGEEDVLALPRNRMPSRIVNSNESTVVTIGSCGSRRVTEAEKGSYPTPTAHPLLLVQSLRSLGGLDDPANQRRTEALMLHLVQTGDGHAEWGRDGVDQRFGVGVVGED